MTILLAALGLLPSAVDAVPVRRPAPDRVDRQLVALRVVRDLDRDGVPDLCLRAQADGRAEIAAISAAQGSVLWRNGGPEGVVDWTGAPLAGALAPLGDHDRDGLGEVAALWRDTDAAGELRGVVLALHAGSDGHVLRVTDLSRGPATELATTLVATGDLDGDLLPDLLVLAPARDLYPGRVAAISSASGGELWSARTAGRGDEHGASIAPLRDLDGDGTVDNALVVGDAIEVLSGRDGRLVKRLEMPALREIEAPAAGAPAGTSAETDPEATSDAPTASPSVQSEADPDLARRWIMTGTLAVIGDLDGDSVPDLWVPQRLSLGHASSAALVSVGGASLLARRALPVWAPELGATAFRAAGDVDRDKRIDILCADPCWNLPGAERTGGVDVGAVRILSGTDGSTLRAWHGGLTLAHVGRLNAIAGDVDRDGTYDVWTTAVDTSSRPHEVLGLASGRTGEFLRWIDVGRLATEGRP